MFVDQFFFQSTLFGGNISKIVRGRKMRGGVKNIWASTNFRDNIFGSKKKFVQTPLDLTELLGQIILFFFSKAT